MLTEWNFNSWGEDRSLIPPRKRISIREAVRLSHRTGVTIIHPGSLVKVKGTQESLYLVLSIGEKPGEGQFAHLLQTSPLPARDAGLFRLDGLEELTSAQVGIGDGLSRLVVQSLARKSELSGMSIRAGATEFKLFQFRPLLCYLRNHRNRILIADEPGLGKTVSASYIMIEEIASHPVNRILILCPPHLIGKWQGELWNRFGMLFEEVRARDLMKRLNKPDGFKCIVSMNAMSSQLKISVFRKEIMACPHIDMLIVDEAHNLIGRNSGSLRREFALSLSVQSKRVVALTATPLQIELEDLKRVFDVVAPGEWDDPTFLRFMEIQALLNRLGRSLGDTRTALNKFDLDRTRDEATMILETIGDVNLSSEVMRVLSELEQKASLTVEDRIALRRELWNISPLSRWMTRARRIEVGEYRKREPLTEKIRLSNETISAFQNGVQVTVSEQSVFEEIDSFLRDSFYHVHRRQLSSCLPAMSGLLSLGLQGFRCWSDGKSVISDEEHELLSQDEAIGFRPKRRPLDREELRRCKNLADKNLLIRGTDTKFDFVLSMIRALRDEKKIRKAVVFAEWRPTMSYFLERMQEVHDIKWYHVSGDDSDDTRYKTLAAFQGYKGFAVLFTADVLAEGIDMQSADCIVNYDLPYNPQRIDQRIGRLDRIGQESKEITIMNPVVAGSTDEEVYNLLVTRLDLFGDHVGEFSPILVSPAEDGFRADEAEIASELHRQEMIRRLQEHDSINGLDDILDSQTVEMFKNRRYDFGELRILVLRDFFQMVLGGPSRVRYDFESGLLRIANLTRTDADALAGLLPIEIADSVRKFVLAFTDESSELAISTEPGKGDWYIPLMHPIMDTAIRLVFRIHYPEGSTIPTTGIVIENQIPCYVDGQNSVLITEHSLSSQSFNYCEWKWWRIGAENHESVHPLERKMVWGALLNDILMAETKYEIIEREFQLSDDARNDIEKEHNEWKTRMREKGVNDLIRGNESMIKNLEFELERILQTERDIKEEDTDTSGLKWRANVIVARLQSIRAQTDELKSNPGHHVKALDNWRVVSVISVGGDDG